LNFITEVVTEIPRSFSIDIQSLVACRAVPFALTAPACWIVDCSAEKEQLFRQRGLAGVRMTDDTEGSSAVNFFLIVTSHKLS
jgi:hypothetical protein